MVGLSGLPSRSGSGATGNAVAATLSKTAFKRRSGGRRYLRITSLVAETVDARARQREADVRYKDASGATRIDTKTVKVPKRRRLL